MSAPHITPEIKAAELGDAETLGELFDAYRRFYGRPAAPSAARRYVEERITNGPTRFFLSRAEGRTTGFVHLLPSFDTLKMAPMWLLEDLYVIPSARLSGTGTALLRHAEAFARETGASRLTLSTAHDNHRAQRLYERNGWVLDTEFRYYHRILL